MTLSLDRWCLARGGHPVAVVGFHTVVETPFRAAPSERPAEAGADVTPVRAGLKMGLGGLETWIRMCFGFQPQPRQVCEILLVETVSRNDSLGLGTLGNPVPQRNG